jgi:lysophospholipase L1-like esterase
MNSQLGFNGLIRLVSIGMLAATPGRFLTCAAELPAPAQSSEQANTNIAIVPVTWLERDSYNWEERHAQVLDLQKTLDPENVLIGDSITHLWGGPPISDQQNGPKAWADTFGGPRVLNLGFGWDRTQNVLWRLDHGEMDGTHPKVVVVNIGSNNFSRTRNARDNSPAEVAEAIAAIFDRIHKKSPQSRIIVMGVFPRGFNANDPFRARITALNELLARQLAAKPLIRFLDISDQLVTEDGTIDRDIMSDGVHPTEAGYAIWGKALRAASVLTETPPPAGKLAPRPLYRDPPFDAPTDPVLCFNAESQKWFMYYTARRAAATNAPGVTWVHGSNIGMAESSDGGATWSYRGTADISYGKDTHPDDYTYWAPEVIWFEGTYHMYLSYVPGIFTDWNHSREIVHLTSKDGVKWDTVAKVDLQSERTIDPCVIQIPNGTWRMWYKDEQKPKPLSYADSADLYHWQTKGTAVTNFSGEGPKVIHWKGSYWLIVDCWQNGMRVWRSDDCLNWKLQNEALFGSHGDVVIGADRAWWFYFDGPRPFGRPRPGAQTQPAATNAPLPQRVPNPAGGRTTAINVVELSVIDGKLIPGDSEQPTYIDLKPVREEER